ncbi:methyltransferase domain-containing protein [Bradyrhizobium sp. URHD0069]|uniref:SAM-dependent methyltransferase n=1 Tax=Bradyrhizobium sp. URHD0069 TaxID=1380355 RepID=UPI00068A0915
MKNLRVVTADLNVFGPERQFDRIVPVEMFEHVINWRELMMRIRSWLAADGRLFMHVFTPSFGRVLVRWRRRIAQHFFTGG